MTKLKIDQNEVSIAERYLVPESASLETSILEQTKLLQQEQPRSEASTTTQGLQKIVRKIGSHSWFSGEGLRPAMAICVIAVASLIILKVGLNSESTSSTVETSLQQSQAFPEDESMDQLDWQELLLLQDEMAFASL